MKVTRASDYAIRSLIHIAKKPEGTVFMRSELSKACDIPDSFLGKILQNLAKADILSSERGKKGGFRLNRPTQDITVYDIIRAIEGELSLNECIFDDSFCSIVNTCSAHKMWGSIQDSLLLKLKSYTLKQLADDEMRGQKEHVQP
ncbi:Rrf2 family transcriptional regulator [Geovibrio thiophilus]|uniref:Rrf2 family transcriptional regulator n=1 Tax=Geovibrio thiophilus TaxID=139438 RepID=A0A410JZH9_9BACT|nr:Rrf2 family transcriptional regulator [Geovibrio thiophilus]QAR33564.1 Rrf2 family transcriptional regulator [Geovibrio thiophilus]